MRRATNVLRGVKALWRRWRSPALAAADVARDRGQASQAAALYAKAMLDLPGRSDLRVQRANMLKDSQQHEEAEQEYLRAAIERPDDPDVQLQLGHLYKMNGERAKAVEHYRRAGMLSPGLADASLQQRELGDPAALEMHFQAAIAAKGIESLLTVVGDLRRIRDDLDALLRPLPELAVQVAFPLAHYDTLRQIWDAPPPPIGVVRPASLLIHMDDVAHASLNRMVSGIIDQSSPDFEIVLFGEEASRRTWARRLAISDARVTLADGGAGLAQLIESARHDLIVLTPPGAVLHKHALAWFGWAAEHTAAAAFVCDLETLGSGPDRRRDPLLGQAVDYEALLQWSRCDYALAVDRARAMKLEPLARGISPSVRYELLLELAAEQPVGHIPFPLIAVPDDGDQPLEGATRAAIVRRHLSRRGLAEMVEVTPGGERLGVRWRAKGRPSIHAVVPTRDNGKDAARLVRSLAEHATQPGRLSVTVMDNGTVDPGSLEELAALESESVRLQRCDEPFNWSRLSNLGAEAADADILVFINDDMLMLTDGWDDLAAGLLQRPEIGIVGAKLLYPDDTIQHAGIIFGWRGRAIHDGLYEQRDAPGPGGRWQLRRRVSAVTGAFLAMRKPVFSAVGGFDAQRLAVGYSDLDMALKVRARGLAVIYAPEIELTHYESKSRGLTHLNEATAAVDDAELAVMRARWPQALDADIGVHPAWCSATLPFRLIRAVGSEEALRHLRATAAPDPWAPPAPTAD
jgi:GT2 family glycosyltransferase